MNRKNQSIAIIDRSANEKLKMPKGEFTEGHFRDKKV